MDVQLSEICSPSLEEKKEIDNQVQNLMRIFPLYMLHLIEIYSAKIPATPFRWEICADLDKHSNNSGSHYGYKSIKVINKTKDIS